MENGYSERTCEAPRAGGALRVLVAIASYGNSNDRHLRRLLAEYRSMSFETDVFVLSNIEKTGLGDARALVGLPAKNPWSLPFAHKQLFMRMVGDYDLFVYSEDDILLTENNLRAFMHATSVLREDEIAGFFRFEQGTNGAIHYPDVHWRFHWDPESVRTRGQYTLAHFTNEHAGCYALTRAQLMKAIESGGFDVAPHDYGYDMLCAAATDPYTRCGSRKLIPISHIDDFAVHHMSNKYVGRTGIDSAEMRRQTDALLRIARNGPPSVSLLAPQTRLWRGIYSKDYYEPANAEIISLAPKPPASVLSIGCGLGATEIALIQEGFSVTAVPLDPIICRAAAEAGVEIIGGDFRSARSHLEGRCFDALLLLNLLHLSPDPVELLSLFRDLLSPSGAILIQSPNMANVAAMWRRFRTGRNETPFSFAHSGAHFSTMGKLRQWCSDAGLTIEHAGGVLYARAEAFEAIIPAVARPALSWDIIAVARRA